MLRGGNLETGKLSGDDDLGGTQDGAIEETKAGAEDFDDLAFGEVGIVAEFESLVKPGIHGFSNFSEEVDLFGFKEGDELVFDGEEALAPGAVGEFDGSDQGVVDIA